MAALPTLTAPPATHIKERMRSHFAVHTGEDSSITSISWLRSKPGNRSGKEQIVTSFFYYWHPNVQDFVIVPRAEEMLPTAEAMKKLHDFDQAILSGTKTETDIALPKVLQQPARIMHYENALYHPENAPDLHGEISQLDEDGMPLSGHVSQTALVRAHQSSNLPTKGVCLKTGIVTLRGKQMHLSKSLLVVNKQSSTWLHLASEDEDEMFKEISHARYGVLHGQEDGPDYYEYYDGQASYYGIQRRKSKCTALIIVEDSNRNEREIFNISERELRRELWSIEDFNNNWEQLSDLDKKETHRREMEPVRQLALLAFEKLKANPPAGTMVMPIRRSLVGRAVDWAYENLP